MSQSSANILLMLLARLFNIIRKLPASFTLISGIASLIIVLFSKPQLMLSIVALLSATYIPRDPKDIDSLFENMNVISSSS